MNHVSQCWNRLPIVLALVAFFSGTLKLGAQVADPAISGTGHLGYGLGLPRPGLRLSTITAFSTLMPANSGTFLSGSSSSSWGLMNGVTGSGGWAKTWQASSLSLNYSGGYTRRAQLVDSAQVFHNFGLSYSARFKLSRRWDYTASLRGTVTDMESYLYLPQTSNGLPVSVTPTVTDPFDPRIGTSPANFALFGRRFLSTSLANTLDFRKSARLVYTMSANLSRSQFLGGASGANGSAGNRFLNGVIFASTNAGLRYTLTPRTNLIANVMVSRSLSSLVSNNYFTNALAGVGRTMKPWWQLQVNAGVGYNISSNGTASSRPRMIGGLSTTLNGYQQSLNLSASMVAFDPFGIGAGTTTMGAASWSWHRPAARWAVMASATESMSRRPGGSAFTAWSASTGLNRVLTNQLFFTLSGSYTNVQGLSNFGGLGGLGGGLGGGRFGYRGVRAALTWTPTMLRW